MNRMNKCPGCSKYLISGQCLTPKCIYNRSNLKARYEAMMREKAKAMGRQGL